MNLRRKWGVVAGTLLVAGGLLTGVAFAANAADTNAAPATNAPAAAKERPALTEGEKQVHEQLRSLWQSTMEKLKADSKAVIDEAVQKGTITQEQADKLQQRGMHGKLGPKAGKMHGRGKGMMGPALSAEELKAKLDEAVKSGKMTREQADKILEHHSAMLQKKQQ